MRPGNSASRRACSPLAARPATWFWTLDTEAPIWNGTRTTLGCRLALSVRPASHAAAGPDTMPTVNPPTGGSGGAWASWHCCCGAGWLGAGAVLFRFLVDFFLLVTFFLVVCFLTISFLVACFLTTFLVTFLPCFLVVCFLTTFGACFLATRFFARFLACFL